MTYAATHLAGLAVLLAAFVGAGAAIEGIAGSPRTTGEWAGFTRVIIGITAWLIVLFACAALGLLEKAPLVTAVGATAAFAIVTAWRNGKSHVDALRDFIRTPTNVGRVAFVGPAIVLISLLFVSLTPVVGWDDRVYHLTLPRIYLEHGGFRRIPFNVYSNWPLNAELLYALAMLVHDYVLAKLIHLAFLALTIFATYRLASRHAFPLAGSIAASLLLANPVLLDEARFAYIDLAFAFFFFMAFVHACEHLDDRRITPLFLSGVCCGLVAGTKLTGAIAAPSVGILVIASRVIPNRWAEFRGAVRDVALWLVLPAALLALPWYVRSYVYTANPFYPLFYDQFGGQEWTTELNRQLLDWQRSIGMGRGLLDYILLPVRVALQGATGYAHFDGRINPLWVLLVPFSATRIRSSPLVRRSLGMAAMYFAVWAATSQQARFLIPMLPFLAVAAGVAVAEVLDNVAPGRSYQAIVSVTVGVALLWSARFVIRDGATDASQLLAHGFEVPGDVRNDTERFISEQLPADARLLLLNTNEGFFINREYVADSFFEASQINALLLQGEGGAIGISRRLRGMGITHVLFARRDWAIPYPPALGQFLGNSGLTQLVYKSEDGQYWLFQIRGATSRPIGE